AGVGDHDSLDITRHEFEFRLHRRSKGMVAADREDRHAKLPDLRKQRFVLFGVSRKGGKLAAEGVVNGAGPRIQLSIGAACVLINRRWIRGHLVVETIEQNAFPTGHQALYVGSAKVEMPD